LAQGTLKQQSTWSKKFIQPLVATPLKIKGFYSFVSWDSGYEWIFLERNGDYKCVQFSSIPNLWNE